MFQSLLDDSNIENNNVHETIISEVSPWTLHHPKVNLDLSDLSKKDTPAPLFIKKLNEIKDDHSYCTQVYTDGSLPSNASIFTAEASTIDLALDAITLSKIALSDASKLASTYFSLFYRSVHVLYTGICILGGCLC